MEQAGKNTILLVRGTAAEPVGLSAFAAAQPDVQVQTVSGLDEARTALGRQHPTLIVMQSDEPGVQDLRRCAEMAAGAEAVFLLLVRQAAPLQEMLELRQHPLGRAVAPVLGSRQRIGMESSGLGGNLGAL